MLETVDESALAAAIARLLDEPGMLAKLTAEASARRFKTWAGYASELTEWICGLERRDRTGR